MCAAAALCRKNADGDVLERDMSILSHAIFGLFMMVLGGIKIWLHVGSMSALTLTTCNGRTLNLALGQSAGFAQVHCWGCYLFLAGAGLVLLAFIHGRKKRCSVATHMD